MGGLIEHGGADSDRHSGLMAGIQPPLRAACRRRHDDLSKGALHIERAAIAHQEVAGPCELVGDRLERDDLVSFAGLAIEPAIDPGSFTPDRTACSCRKRQKNELTPIPGTSGGQAPTRSAEGGAQKMHGEYDGANESPERAS